MTRYEVALEKLVKYTQYIFTHRTLGMCRDCLFEVGYREALLEAEAALLAAEEEWLKEHGWKPTVCGGTHHFCHTAHGGFGRTAALNLIERQILAQMLAERAKS